MVRWRPKRLDCSINRLGREPAALRYEHRHAASVSYRATAVHLLTPVVTLDPHISSGSCFRVTDYFATSPFYYSQSEKLIKSHGGEIKWTHHVDSARWRPPKVSPHRDNSPHRCVHPDVLSVCGLRCINSRLAIGYWRLRLRLGLRS